MKLAIPEIDATVTGIRWGDTESAHPPVIYSLGMAIIKPIALQWIDDNKPQAWFREMFVS